MIKKIIQSTGNSKIFVEELDLTSFQSITNFSTRILSKNKTIYALVNNAGIFYNKPSQTVDNIEKTFQTNFLGPFLLTILLLPALRKYPGNSRIVNLSSQSHLVPYLFPQPEFHKEFEETEENYFKSYEYSKFCIVLFANKLGSLLFNSNVSVHCVDPGNTETNIFRYFPQLSNKILYILQKPIRFFVIKTPREGAQTVLHTILYNKIPPFYLKDLEESKIINKRVFDPILADTLWLMSRKFCQNYLTSTVN